MRILIAEDDPSVQRLLERLAANWGYEPVIADDGQQAWEILQADDGPSLALIDWMMPGLSGLEVCRRVRCSNAPGYRYLIMLTGRSAQKDAIAALESGADDVITKPFHPHELRARINTAERILALEESLVKRAFFDQLTGLPNRALLAKRFQGGVEAAVRNVAMLAILYIDLDRFKVVNDTFGHAAGDHVLREITCRIHHCLNNGGTLARVGGDEFICLANVDSERSAADLASRVLASLEGAIDADGHCLSTGASIGISMFPQDGEGLEILVQSADAAMYDLKRRRLCKQFQFFNKDIGERRRSSLLLETRLPGALQRNEFMVHYQPILRSSDGTFLGAEWYRRENSYRSLRKRGTSRKLEIGCWSRGVCRRSGGGKLREREPV